MTPHAIEDSKYRDDFANVTEAYSGRGDHRYVDMCEEQVSTARRALHYGVDSVTPTFKCSTMRPSPS